MDRLPAPLTVARTHVLWDELADFEVANGDAALAYMLHVVAELVSAQNAFWLGVVRIMDDRLDPLRGWRPRAVRYLHPSTGDELLARKTIRKYSQGLSDEPSRAHVKQAGRFRAPLIRELVSTNWHESELYKRGYAARGIVDVLYVVVPLDTSAEAYYGFHRTGASPLFAEEDRLTAAYALRGLRWFHRQVMLSYGLLGAPSPLAPTERRVLRLLMSDLTESQIARRLGLTGATTHKYITGVFRHFRVSGRAGLTALFLGKPPDLSGTFKETQKQTDTL